MSKPSLPPSVKIPTSVLVVIHTPALLVLLLERADHPGFWQSVTGSLETVDEPLALACSREVAEETGWIADPEQFDDWHQTNRYPIFPHWRHRYAPGVTHNCEHVFSLCVPRAFDARLSPLEHLDSRWLDWRAASERCFSWTNAQAILALPARERPPGARD